MLQRFEPRKPMMWGAMILGLCALLLMQTQVLVGTYVVLAVIAYVLFGLGLAFYAMPSTDAALSNLLPAQSGAGAGIYKMASSLGAAIAVLPEEALLGGRAGVTTGVGTGVGSGSWQPASDTSIPTPQTMAQVLMNELIVLPPATCPACR
ncbi:MAG: hypothetical protein L0G49_13695 [Luteococcus sp.]|uniref:hypothetical protein n=1 Tax=Luteococcus sp. TaxID=1969402 RepID=UPI0026472884|nr:hypothetical protein [Luteococcus sp.]MDN5564795.1 hypothetical protein [Luteococcus sp.]